MSEEVTILISSNPPPRPSILRVPSTSRSDGSTPGSSSSSTPSSISFAPLPRIEGKKRRNRRPIGLAGRAELLQVSRQRLAEAAEANEDSFFGTDYEFYEQEEEIPLPDIGKLVKGLWRSISRISLRDKQGGTQSTPESTATQADNVKSGHRSEAGTGANTPALFKKIEEDQRDVVDNPEKSDTRPLCPSEIPLPESRSSSSSADQERPQIKISTVSAPSSKDLDVFPKGLDELIQVSVINTLQVQNP